MTDIGVDHWTSFISSQCKPGWETGKDVGVRRAVTISRQAGCGALVVAEKLARYLAKHSPRNAVPWTVLDRNLMDKVLEEHGLPLSLAKFLPEDRVSEIEDMMTEILGAHPSSRKLVEHTAETVLKLAAMGNVILIGRASGLITAKLPRVFHVRLVAPLEQRIAFAHQAYGMTKAEAHTFCLHEDLGRERYVKKYFNADVTDPLLYHMIINTGEVSYDDAAQFIGDAVLKLS